MTDYINGSNGIYTADIIAPRAETTVLTKDGTLSRVYVDYLNNIFRRTGGITNGILSNNQFSETSNTLVYLPGNTLTLEGTFNIEGTWEINNVPVTTTANQLNFHVTSNAPTNGQLLIGSSANSTFYTSSLGSANGISTITGPGSLTVAGVYATTSNVGVASYNPAFFTVNSGNVSIATNYSNQFITSVVGTHNQIDVITANGVSTISVDANYIVPSTQGGTGANNNGATISILNGNTSDVLTRLANGSGVWAVPTGGGGGGNISAVVGTANRISAITSLGTVTVNVDANYVGQSSITTLGNINTGTWSATPVNLSVYASGTLQAGQFPALLGDITTSAGNLTTILATVNSNIGSFGNSTAIPVATVNAKGLVTAITTSPVIAPAGTLTGTVLNSTVVSSSLTSVGTLLNLTLGGTINTANTNLAALVTQDIFTTTSSNYSAYQTSIIPTFTSSANGMGTAVGQYIKTTVTGSGNISAVYGLVIDLGTASGANVTQAAAANFLIPNYALNNNNYGILLTAQDTAGNATGCSYMVSLTGTMTGTDSSGNAIALYVNPTIMPTTNSSTASGLVVHPIINSYSTDKVIAAAGAQFSISGSAGNGSITSATTVQIFTPSNMSTSVTTAGLTVTGSDTAGTINGTRQMLLINGTITGRSTGGSMLVMSFLPTIIPTHDSAIVYGGFFQPTVQVFGNNTVTQVLGVFSAPVLTPGNGSITAAYSGYFQAPVGAVTNIALYTDNLAVGATTQPPTGGMVLGGIMQYNTGTTGSGTASIGAINCPAANVSAVSTWLQFQNSAGNTIYVPAWK